MHFHLVIFSALPAGRVWPLARTWPGPPRSYLLLIPSLGLWRRASPAVFQKCHFCPSPSCTATSDGFFSPSALGLTPSSTLRTHPNPAHHSHPKLPFTCRMLSLASAHIPASCLPLCRILGRLPFSLSRCRSGLRASSMGCPSGH